VGLRAGLDWCGKSRHNRDSIPGPSSPYAVAILTELPGPVITTVITNTLHEDIHTFKVIFISNRTFLQLKEFYTPFGARIKTQIL